MTITIILVAAVLVPLLVGRALRWRRQLLDRKETERALVALFNKTVESLGALLSDDGKEVSDAFGRLSAALDSVEPIVCRIELEERLAKKHGNRATMPVPSQSK
jgi:hypothetical protein